MKEKGILGGGGEAKRGENSELGAGIPQIGDLGVVPPHLHPELQGNPRDVTEDSNSDPSRNAAGISLISLLQPCSTVFLDETLDCPDPRPGCAPGLLPSSGGAGTLQSVKMIPLRKLEDIPAWNNNGDTGKRGGKYF